MQLVALLLDHDVDAHRLFQIDAVVVDEALGLEAAVRPFRDGRAQLRFRHLEQPRASRRGSCRSPNFADQLVEPPLAQPVGAELAADVAEHQFGRAAVGGDDALDVGVRRVAALVAHRRQMQALVEDLARLAGAASRHRAADVALVRDRAAEAEQRRPRRTPA